MKNFWKWIVPLVVPFTAFGGDISNVIKFGPYNNGTNATLPSGLSWTNSGTYVSATNEAFVWGDVVGVSYLISGSSSTIPTQSVQIVTAGSAAGLPARVIYTNTVVATGTSGYHPLVMQAYNNVLGTPTNAYAKIPLYQDKVACTYGSSLTTNTTITFWLWIK